MAQLFKHHFRMSAHHMKGVYTFSIGDKRGRPSESSPEEIFGTICEGECSDDEPLWERRALVNAEHDSLYDPITFRHAGKSVTLRPWNPSNCIIAAGIYNRFIFMPILPGGSIFCVGFSLSSLSHMADMVGRQGKLVGVFDQTDPKAPTEAERKHFFRCYPSSYLISLDVQNAELEDYERLLSLPDACKRTFLMALHPRAGARSPVRRLLRAEKPERIFCRIFDFVQCNFVAAVKCLVYSHWPGKRMQHMDTIRDVLMRHIRIIQHWRVPARELVREEAREEGGMGAREAEDDEVSSRDDAEEVDCQEGTRATQDDKAPHVGMSSSSSTGWAQGGPSSSSGGSSSARTRDRRNGGMLRWVLVALQYEHIPLNHNNNATQQVSDFTESVRHGDSGSGHTGLHPKEWVLLTPFKSSAALLLLKCRHRKSSEGSHEQRHISDLVETVTEDHEADSICEPSLPQTYPFGTGPSLAPSKPPPPPPPRLLAPSTSLAPALALAAQSLPPPPIAVEDKAAGPVNAALDPSEMPGLPACMPLPRKMMSMSIDKAAAQVPASKTAMPTDAAPNSPAPSGSASTEAGAKLPAPKERAPKAPPQSKRGTPAGAPTPKLATSQVLALKATLLKAAAVASSASGPNAAAALPHASAQTFLPPPPPSPPPPPPPPLLLPTGGPLAGSPQADDLSAEENAVDWRPPGNGPPVHELPLNGPLVCRPPGGRLPVHGLPVGGPPEGDPPLIRPPTGGVLMKGHLMSELPAVEATDGGPLESPELASLPLPEFGTGRLFHANAVVSAPLPADRFGGEEHHGSEAGEEASPDATLHRLADLADKATAEEEVPKTILVGVEETEPKVTAGAADAGVGLAAQAAVGTELSGSVTGEAAATEEATVPLPPLAIPALPMTTTVMEAPSAVEAAAALEAAEPTEAAAAVEEAAAMEETGECVEGRSSCSSSSLGSITEAGAEAAAVGVAEPEEHVASAEPEGGEVSEGQDVGAAVDEDWDIDLPEPLQLQQSGSMTTGTAAARSALALRKDAMMAMFVPVGPHTANVGPEQQQLLQQQRQFQLAAAAGISIMPQSQQLGNGFGFGTAQDQRLLRRPWDGPWPGPEAGGPPPTPGGSGAGPPPPPGALDAGGGLGPAPGVDWPGMAPPFTSTYSSSSPAGRHHAAPGPYEQHPGMVMMQWRTDELLRRSSCPAPFEQQQDLSGGGPPGSPPWGGVGMQQAGMAPVYFPCGQQAVRSFGGGPCGPAGPPCGACGGCGPRAGACGAACGGCGACGGCDRGLFVKGLQGTTPPPPPPLAAPIAPLSSAPCQAKSLRRAGEAPLLPGAPLPGAPLLGGPPPGSPWGGGPPPQPGRGLPPGYSMPEHLYK